MVRIKHRYLLVNILYPDAESQPQASRKDESVLPPTVDFRRPSPSYLTAGLLVRHIRDHMEMLYGDYGMGMTGSGLTVKYFSQATSTFIVRCPVAHFRMIWSALTFMTQLPKGSEIKGKGKHFQTRQPAVKAFPCIMRVVRVSGTIRKSEEEAIRRARTDILRAQRQSTSATDEKDVTSTLNAIFSTNPEAPSIEDDDPDEADEDEDDTEI